MSRNKGDGKKNAAESDEKEGTEQIEWDQLGPEETFRLLGVTDDDLLTYFEELPLKERRLVHQHLRTAELRKLSPERTRLHCTRWLKRIKSNNEVLSENIVPAALKNEARLRGKGVIR